jgi:tetratricopeptide (TPR) repeat protein
VFDVGEHAGFAYIAFELIEGPTLRQWQDGKTADPWEAARVIADLARGLQHAHDSGIIHRDVKPANVLLSAAHSPSTIVSRPVPATPSGSGQLVSGDPRPRIRGRGLVPKLTDFGLAKPVDGGLDLTITGMACGTPNYMAPEQVHGRGVGRGVDVYALGAVLFELLTGHPPFRGTDAAEVMDKILRAEPDRARRLNPAVPRDLEVIAAKCLEKDPARRYAAAGDLADDLGRFLAGRPIRARAVGLTERTWRWCRRNPVVTAFLVLSTLALVATGRLALALADAVAVERQARAEIEQEHEAAVADRRAAEQARDDLRGALAKEEAAHRRADAEKAAANAARVEADAARKIADTEKGNAFAQAAIARQQTDRANGNLRVLRSVIRNTFRDMSDHPGLKGPEFRELRVGLVRTGTAFYKTLEAQAGTDPEALAELGECAHFLGYLEYLNGNMDAAAAHYQAAADVFYRWVALDPQNPEPRARMAGSLTNTGNALYHAGRHDRVESRHRDAIALLEWVVDRHPTVEGYHAVLLRAYAPLFEFLREKQRWADAAALCRGYLARTQDLIRLFGPKVEYLYTEARVRQSLGQTLDRSGRTDEAEPHLLEAVAIRERLRDRFGWNTEQKADAARLWYALGQHHMFAKQRHRIPAAGDEAIRLMEEVVAAEPNTPVHLIFLADCCLLVGTAHKWGKEYKAAEPRFDRAISATELALSKNPKPEEARSARATWANAMTARADLYNLTGRQRDAAVQWKKLSEEDPNEGMRPNHRLCVLYSLVYAGDWRAAATGADKLSGPDAAPGFLADLARVWCRISKAAAADEGLSPDERNAEAEKAVKKAVRCLERARAGGVFKKPGAVEFFDGERDYDPVRNKFNPRE